MIATKEITALIRSCTYFQNMDEDSIYKLISFSYLEPFEKGSIIFFQGDESKYMHILLEGSIRMYKSKPSGGEVQLLRANAVASVAELACFEKIPYPASCVCTTASTLLRIPFERFEEEFLSDPKISFGIIRSLSQKLRSLSSLIERELTLSSEQKVAKYIVDNHDKLDSVKQVEIASELNITPETLSRMLKKLQKQGLIESTSPLIIADEKGLTEVYSLF